VERAAVLAKSGIVDAPDIQLRSVSRGEADWTDQIPLSHGWRTNLALAEKAMIVRALRVAAGNKSRAAEILAVHRRLVYEKMREYEINENQRKAKIGLFLRSRGDGGQKRCDVGKLLRQR